MPCLNGTPIRRLVLSRPDRVGDAVTTSACLAAIRDALPGAEIYLIVRPAIEPLFSDHPLLAGVLGTPAEASVSLREPLAGLAPEAIVHFNPDLPIEAAARDAGVPVRIGWSKGRRRGTLTHSLADRRKRCERLEVEYCLELLAPLGVRSPERLAPLLSPDPAARAAVRERCPWLDGETPYAVLHPSAHARKTTIPADRMVALARRLREGRGLDVVVVGTEVGHVAVRALREGIDAPWLHDTVGRLSLAETAWLVAGAALVVGRDSGVTHLAGAMGAPTLTVVGPLARTLAARRWRPLGPRTACLELPVRHRPLESIAGYHARYFEAVTVEGLDAAVSALLDGPSRP
jgi:ADP-heptose:LPS heptosyltransferase